MATVTNRRVSAGRENWMPHSESAEASNGAKKINHPIAAAASTSVSTIPNSLPIGIAKNVDTAAIFATINRMRSFLMGTLPSASP